MSDIDPEDIPSLSTTAPSSWRYTAEGGANLVLSYVGPPSTFSGKLLRLRKKKRVVGSGGAIPEDVGIVFGEQVIKPLLGEEQVVRMEKVEIVTDWLKGIKRMLHESGVRPKERADEDEIDEERGVVVLAEDLIHGEGVLAIEIKPKWGFLPSADHLSSDTKDIKTQYCRFCMHTFLKTSPKIGVEAALEHHARGYCPLDLYSGDAERISRAIDGLWRGWIKSGGTANNLRFFIDGKRLAPTNQEDLDSLTSFLSSWSPSAALDTTAPLPLLIASVLPTLLTSPTLSTLANLQRTLDPLDIEGIATRLLPTIDLSQPSPDLSSLGEQPSMEEWADWLAARLTSNEPATTRDLLLSYLLSATFKDCSIFIRLARDDNGELTTSVKAIDLDPKPLDRLGKYWKLDREIVETWKGVLAEVGAEGVRKCIA